jgi:hypothetical protein
LEEENATERAKKGESLGKKKQKKNKKTRKQTVRPPEAVFESGCFDFIQGSNMHYFIKSLPTCFHRDRLFSLLILQCLFRLLRLWAVEALKAAPLESRPQIPGLQPEAEQHNFRIVVSVDQGSEVHRFVASAVTVNCKVVAQRIKQLQHMRTERRKAFKPPKDNHNRELAKMEAVKRILDDLGVLRRDIPKFHDSSYDSPMLEALNRGGLLFVSPRFLAWANSTMKKIRASLTKEVISSLGNKSQKMAYAHLLADSALKEDFERQASKSGDEISKDAIHWVFKRIVNFAFHARSAVEWQKYRAEKTDRTAGKAKKMGIREFLKAGSGTKTTGDGND